VTEEAPMSIEQRTAHIRRDMMRAKPLLARLERGVQRLEAEMLSRREGLARLRADIDALEMRLQQLDGADDALVGLLSDAVGRVWADVQRDLRRLSVQRPDLVRPLA
jgi:uncharacterized protein (DUF3084 family)